MKYDHSNFPGKPVQQGQAREEALASGLRRLANAHGITFREPLRIGASGNFMLAVSNGTERDGKADACGKYGTALAGLISRHNPRTGYAPTATMSPEGGWCYMNHFDVQSMLEEAGI